MDNALLEIIVSPFKCHIFYLFSKKKSIAVMSGGRECIRLAPLPLKFCIQKSPLIGYKPDEYNRQELHLLSIRKIQIIQEVTKYPFRRIIHQLTHPCNTGPAILENIKLHQTVTLNRLRGLQG